jgi:WD40 repeat protein
MLLAAAPLGADEKVAHRVAMLIEQLGSEDYELREEAGRELAALGAPAVEALRKAAASHQELEVRFRAKELLGRVQKYLFSEVGQLEGHRKDFPAEPFRIWVTRSAVTADGKRLYTVAGDALREWDLDGRKLTRSFGEFEGLYFTLGLSAAGDKAITGVTNSWAVAVWDLRAGRELTRLSGHTAQVLGALFTTDGKHAITGGWDKTIRVWDLASGQEVRQFEGVRDNVRCLALSSDGTRLAAGHFAEVNQPGILRIWDVASGKELASMTAHSLEITSVSFSPDGSRVLTSSFDGMVRLSDAFGGRPLREFRGHTGRVEGAAFSPDGRYLYSVGDESDRTLRVWDAETGENLFTSDPQPSGLLSVTALPDNLRVVTTGKDGVIKLWQWNR